jgi:radical SAM enzyme (TIGR01210 family)
MRSTSRTATRSRSTSKSPETAVTPSGAPGGRTLKSSRLPSDARPVTPESLARTVARDRRPEPAGPTDARRYVNQWVEREAIGPDEVSAFVLILRTRGCYWADEKGCSMCGYAKDTLGRSATPEELTEQLTHAVARYREEPYVKIYTSGSFLDDREVDPESRRNLAAAFSGRARRLLFETLPEFAVEERLRPLQEAFAGEVEVALGLESTNPTVLGRYVHKNAPPSEYLAAGDRVRALGLRSKAYLLLKPPYLTESESVQDVVQSVTEAAPHFDAMSINPVHIQNGTVVEWLFRRGRYRPPWLWSVVAALEAGAPRRGQGRLVSFPTAGGLPRGPHNCGSCDTRVLAAIETASLRQEFEPLRELTCECRAEWEATRSLEPLGVEA